MSSQHQKRRWSPLRVKMLEQHCLLTTYIITDCGANLIPVALNNRGDVAGVMTNSSGQAGEAVG